MSLKDYERPSLTTDMVLFRMKNYVSTNNRKSDAKRLEVLLIERTSEPEKGKWSLPGGFVDIDEEIESNVKRKLMEKTGVSGNFYIEQLYTFGGLDRDSRGRVVSVSYVGLVNDYNHTNVGGTERQTWMDAELALCDDLAFDHKEIIQYAIARLQGKAEYTDILFNLMPKEFTISDLQSVYEAILCEKLDNFKRRINKYLKPLNKIREGKQHRPAELYTWNRNDV